MKHLPTILGACCLLVILSGAGTAAQAECTPCNFCYESVCSCGNCGGCSVSPCFCNYCNLFGCHCSPCPSPWSSCVSSSATAAQAASDREKAATEAAAERGRQIFRAMDTNRNQSVSKAEFAAWAKKNAAYVKDHAGTRSVDQLFADVDKDKDNRITVAETGCGSRS